MIILTIPIKECTWTEVNLMSVYIFQKFNIVILFNARIDKGDDCELTHFKLLPSKSVKKAKQNWSTKNCPGINLFEYQSLPLLSVYVMVA